MLIDTHCHLTDKKYTNISDVIELAKRAGVEKMIVPGTDLDDSRKAIEIADNYEQVWAMVGVHPENIAHLSFSIAQSRAELARMVGSSKKVVGIGEIGLDNYLRTREIKNSRTRGQMKRQIEVFKMQLELAAELNLPVVIHMREAEEEMRGVLDELTELPRGQFHCWSGREELLKLVLEKGFYVSFCGNITYPSADNLRRLAKLVPLDRLLLETDSPYLSPEPVRGSVNIPSNVKILAEYLANLLRIPVEILVNQTTKNAKCLYLPG